MNKYICHYEAVMMMFRSDKKTTDYTCEGSSLFDFKDGFWIDGEGNFTKSDGVYWIPPSRIYYVEKREVEELEF
jgi:hypothetical protein